MRMRVVNCNTKIEMMTLLFLLSLASAALAQGQCSDVMTGLKVSWTVIDSPVDWTPRFAGSAGEGSVVMVASQKHTLYRSVNDGKTFNIVQLPGRGNASVAAFGVHFTAKAQTQFYAYGQIGGEDAYWTTTDAGATFSLHWPNAEKILWINPHPLLANVALGLAAGGHSAEYAQSTYLTTDFGQTWARVGGNTTFQSMFGCESPACPRKTAIIFQEAPRGEAWDDCRGGTCHVSRVEFDPSKPSASALGSASQIGDSINGFGETHWPWYDPSAKSVLYISARVCDKSDGSCADAEFKQRVRFSTDGGLSWKTARFPFDTQHTMRFVSTERDVLLVGIRHEEAAQESDYGDLYVASISPDSPEVGFFTRSLQHVQMIGKQWWENSMFAGQLAVERQGELDGVLLANRYRAKADGTADTTCLQTVISFDMGASWGLVAAPKGACAPGAQDCTLHLVMPPADFPGVYSPIDAVGLTISDGMVGQCLDLNAKSYGTYVTWDGGASFVTMSKEPLIYEVSNHGALVVGAQIKTLTNQFVYTSDMGTTFQTCMFTKASSVVVDNILTRSFNARNFVMHGRMSDTTGAAGFLAHFDFDDVHERECTAADYEQWSPSKQCLLGEHLVFQRRQPQAQCHNPINVAPPTAATCQCADDDYECDFCFEKNSAGMCVVQPTKACQAFASQPEALLCAGDVQNFTVTDGYRLEPNNRCKGGVQHGVVKPCPEKYGSVGGSDNASLVAGIISGSVVIAIVLAGIAFIYFKRRGKVQYMTMADEN